MPIRSFQLIGGHPALDLVNCLDWRFRESGPEELLESYDDLIRFTEQSKLLLPRHARCLARAVSRRAAERVLNSCRALRETLAEVFYTALEGRQPSLLSVKKLQNFMQDARFHQRLIWRHGHMEWEWQATEGRAELPLWVISSSVSALMTSGDFTRVGACENDECRWLFLDTSKNHTRRWCDMKLCGNRMKARRFKAQNCGR